MGFIGRDVRVCSEYRRFILSADVSQANFNATDCLSYLRKYMIEKNQEYVILKNRTLGWMQSRFTFYKEKKEFFINTLFPLLEKFAAQPDCCDIKEKLALALKMGARKFDGSLKIYLEMQYFRLSDKWHLRKENSTSNDSIFDVKRSHYFR